MSSLETRRILGSTGRLSWISSGFAWLLRLDDGVPKGVSCVGYESRSEGIKTRLDELPPVGRILNTVCVSIVLSDIDTMLAGESSLELEGLDGGSMEVIRDASDMFELIVHIVPFIVIDGIVQFLINLLNRWYALRTTKKKNLGVRLGQKMKKK